MAQKYAYQKGGTVAKAVAHNVSISTKTAIMVANFVRGKPVARVQRELALVAKLKTAVPMTRFTEGAGHKPGIGAGKYPEKAAKAFLTLINSAAANAQDLGMGDDLVVISANANKGARQPRQSRHRGRQAKATHIEVVVAELETKSKVKKATATKKVAAPKAEPAKAKDSIPSAEPAKAETTPAPAKKAAKSAAKKAAAKVAAKKAAKADTSSQKTEPRKEPEATE